MRIQMMVSWNIWTGQHNGVGHGCSTMISLDGLDWRLLSEEPIAPYTDVITG